MRTTILRVTLAALLVAALVLPAAPPPAAAQQSGPQQQPPPLKQAPKQEPQEQKKEDQEQYTLALEVPLVSVDVVVTDNRGTYVPNLTKENFRVLEDGVPQIITNFAPTDAPITIVMLIEFSKLFGDYAAYTATFMGEYFLPNLKKDDWVALVSYDLRPRIEVDFTKNKAEVAQYLRRMYFPGFREANLFDALHDMIDRLRDVKGKKAILVLGTGFDTFSRKTLDDTLKLLKQTDVTIFSVGSARALFEWLDARGYYGGAWGAADRMQYYQAENHLRSFAEMTGGRSWFPRFQGEWPGIFQDVAGSLRNQYSIIYSPKNRARDGKFRKIKVELVAPDGRPLTFVDEKGKKMKIVVYAREGYLAPKAVGD
jgi:VWFA-related protein